MSWLVATFPRGHQLESVHTLSKLPRSLLAGRIQECVRMVQRSKVDRIATCKEPSAASLIPHLLEHRDAMHRTPEVLHGLLGALPCGVPLGRDLSVQQLLSLFLHVGGEHLGSSEDSVDSSERPLNHCHEIPPVDVLHTHEDIHWVFDIREEHFTRLEWDSNVLVLIRQAIPKLEDRRQLPCPPFAIEPFTRGSAYSHELELRDHPGTVGLLNGTSAVRRH
mmetsp:Transcript_38461/g.46403  ORF Transcript_38461/g.46403 Transcript_38461/m.46403 type:complete len:221 (+) Transcript_38461:659-1321(+)